MQSSASRSNTNEPPAGSRWQLGRLESVRGLEKRIIEMAHYAPIFEEMVSRMKIIA